MHDSSLVPFVPPRRQPSTQSTYLHNLPPTSTPFPSTRRVARIRLRHLEVRVCTDTDSDTAGSSTRCLPASRSPLAPVHLGRPPWGVQIGCICHDPPLSSSSECVASCLSSSPSASYLSSSPSYLFLFLVVISIFLAFVPLVLAFVPLVLAFVPPVLVVVPLLTKAARHTPAPSQRPPPSPPCWAPGRRVGVGWKGAPEGVSPPLDSDEGWTRLHLSALRIPIRIPIHRPTASECHSVSGVPTAGDPNIQLYCAYDTTCLECRPGRVDPGSLDRVPPGSHLATTHRTSLGSRSDRTDVLVSSVLPLASPAPISRSPFPRPIYADGAVRGEWMDGVLPKARPAVRPCASRRCSRTIRSSIVC